MTDRWRIICLLVTGVGVVGGAWREHLARERRHEAREEAERANARRAEVASQNMALRAWSQQHPVFHFIAPVRVSPTPSMPGHLRLAGTVANPSGEEIAGVAFTIEMKRSEIARPLRERLYLPFPVPAGAEARDFQCGIAFPGRAASPGEAPLDEMQLAITDVVSVTRKVAEPWLNLSGPTLLALFLDARLATEIK